MAVSSGKCPTAQWDWLLKSPWEPPVEDWSQLILDKKMAVGEEYEDMEYEDMEYGDI
jgi:hypothetical protein